MRAVLKKYLASLAIFALVIFIGTNLSQISNLDIGKQSAAVIDLVEADSSATTTSGYAWSDTVGWINFGTDTSHVEGRVYVSDTKLYGYAWGENIGWISMTCENIDGSCDDFEYGVSNDSIGNLSGEAWGENIGWIKFNPDGGGVTINRDTGVFSGHAWGENIGWISFSDTPNNQGVETAWTNPTPAPPPEDPGGGGSPDCRSFDYSDWGPCTNGQRTRSISREYPSNCSGGVTATTTESCTVITSTTTPSINVSINTPTQTTIFANQQLQLTATVTGTTSTNLVWNITNMPIVYGNYYGTINDSGLYIAPSFADAPLLQFLTITIQARLQSDQTKTDTISITVRRIIPPPPVVIPFCSEYTYSSWSDCVNGNQTRNVLIRLPANCEGGVGPDISRACQINDEGEIVPIETPDPVENNHPGKSTEKTETLLPIENLEVLGTTTQEIILGAKKIIDNPTGSAVTKTITTAGVIGGGLAATSVLAINGMAIADLAFLPFKVWGLLLSVLGLKKRNRPWGTVYDSVTKQPIDPAYVTLTKINSKDDMTSITDLDGRYGFLVSPGQYLLTANKTNYIFPSKKMAGKTEDALYNNLYLGGEINVPVTGAVISKNIPLDPVKFDWNEFVKGQKKLMKFYSKREKIVRILTDWIFRIGFLVSLISLFLVSAPYNIVIFCLYLLLAVLRKFGLKQKATGALLDKNGNPLSFAIVRIFSADLNVEITNKVADKIGRYYCLVNKGKYFVKVEKKNDDESYSLVYTSPVILADNGIINRNFTV
ncbi:MAG: carboxypeptidase-like regulatory domain-containing protein [Candidatus Paceibacterota bacterium]